MQAAKLFINIDFACLHIFIIEFCLSLLVLESSIPSCWCLAGFSSAQGWRSSLFPRSQLKPCDLLPALVVPCGHAVSWSPNLLFYGDVVVVDTAGMLNRKRLKLLPLGWYVNRAIYQ